MGSFGYPGQRELQKYLLMLSKIEYGISLYKQDRLILKYVRKTKPGQV